LRCESPTALTGTTVDAFTPSSRNTLTAAPPDGARTQDALQTATYIITVQKTIPPPPPLPPPPPVLLTYLASSPARHTASTSAVFNFSTPGANGHGCSLDGAPLAPCPGGGRDTASASYVHLVEGHHSLVVRAQGSPAGAVPLVRVLPPLPAGG
jgi:hypothetical protein